MQGTTIKGKNIEKSVIMLRRWQAEQIPNRGGHMDRPLTTAAGTYGEQ